MSRGLNLIALLFYFINSGISQNYNVRLFSKDEGMSDPYVYALQQDQKGFLWIANGKGLSKFDGQIFKPLDSKFLANDVIYSSAIQKNGVLWFGTSTGKLLYGKAGSTQLDSTSFNGKASITKILASEFSDELYLNTLGKGIVIKRGNNFSALEETENYQVNTIATLSADLLLAGTSEGLILVNLKSKSLSKIKGLEGGIKFIQKSNKTKSTFYFLSDKSEILEAELNSLGELVKTKSLTASQKLTAEINSFFVNEDDEVIFLTTVNERLSYISLNQNVLFEFRENDFLASAQSFFQDKEKNIWITTAGKGLYRISKNPYDFMESSDTIFAITADSSFLYYGTKEGLKTREGQSITRINNKELGEITALYFDGNALWIGTESHGLFVAKQKSLELLPVEFSGIANIAVNSITGSGDKVCVTTNLDGVYNYKNYKLEDHFSVETTLLHNNVYYSLRTKNGKIFYATHNTSFSYSQGKQLYEIDTKDLGLIADFNSLAEGKNGELYIATNGDGMYVMEGETLQPFTLNDELESKFCNGLLCDKDNNIWIMQRYHLYKYYTKEKVLREIKFENNGQLMFNPNSFFRSKKGDLYFGTNKGLVHFNEQDSKGELAQPYLVSLNVQDSLLGKMEEHEEYGYGSYHFNMEFSALGLKNSEDILFKYKLVGHDENWSELSKSRHAEFSKLGEGTYVFKVIAYNAEGFSSGEVALYSFSISSPFWKHPMFWIVAVLSVCILIFLAIRLRTAKLIKEKETLEALVLEKTKELRNEKEIVEKNNLLIEEQNHEIKDSIMYAKRIQDAMLPDKSILQEYHKNLFVLYQPRDIVSGDFYWIGEVNDLKIVAAADCTGHGVPGALMSMIGTTLLNKIVFEKNISSPKEILKELDKEIKLALKQRTEDATRDGMDMCLCCIDLTEGTLTYSGALRPMFYVRDGELIECSPTKHAIGGFSYGSEKEFQECEIAFKRGDMFYLFSDGYADQFGGEKGKKMMLKNFKKILVSISGMNLPEQEEHLKRIYNNWKGDLDQVDDVLVVGIRT